MEPTWFEDPNFYPAFSNEMEMDGAGDDPNAVHTPTSIFAAGQFSFIILT